MNRKELYDKWIEALRSDKYEQDQGCLHPSSVGYCCLGVLTELAVQDSKVKWEGPPDPGTALTSPFQRPAIARACDGFIPVELSEFMGWGEHPDDPKVADDQAAFDRNIQVKLSTMNDTGKWSFKRLATYIEKYVAPKYT